MALWLNVGFLGSPKVTILRPNSTRLSLLLLLTVRMHVLS